MNKDKCASVKVVMEWISVKDRLPDHCEGVLVCGLTDDIPVMSFAKMDCLTKQWQFFYDTKAEFITVPYSDCGWDLYLKDIQYWSYLPKTPMDLENDVSTQ